MLHLSHKKNWIFFQDLDSIGGDLVHHPTATFEQLRKQAEKRSDCVGFNTSGWLKYALAEPSEWVLWGDLHFSTGSKVNEGRIVGSTTNPPTVRGLYVRRNRLKSTTYSQVSKAVGRLLQHTTENGSHHDDLKNIKSTLHKLKDLCQDPNNSIFFMSVKEGAGVSVLLSLSSLAEDVLLILRKLALRQTIGHLVRERVVLALVKWLSDKKILSQLSEDGKATGWDLLVRLTEIPKGGRQALRHALSLLCTGLESKQTRPYAICCVYNVSQLVEAAEGLAARTQLMENLIEVMREGTKREKEQMSSIFWNLALSPASRPLLRKLPVVEALNSYLRLPPQKGFQAAKSTLFCLNSLDNSNEENTSAILEGHVMISYNWTHQSLAKNLSSSLQKFGYKVWIDIEGMASNLLESMAQAVEQASIILILMSNEYKLSQACRTEAEYAYSLKKTIIPLLVAPNYRPDGWLGAFLGMKLYFDFSNPTQYDDSFRKLLHELERHSVPAPLPPTSSSVDLAKTLNSPSNISTPTLSCNSFDTLTQTHDLDESSDGEMEREEHYWSASQVADWLKQFGLEKWAELFPVQDITGSALLELGHIANNESFEHLDRILCSIWPQATLGQRLTLRSQLRQLSR